jgi:uncharacterized Zn-binding protein involved in type VI secretion
MLTVISGQRHVTVTHSPDAGQGPPACPPGQRQQTITVGEPTRCVRNRAPLS